MIVQRATRTVLIPLCRLWLRPAVDGRASVPRTGPLILAVNHLSFLDSFVVPLLAPRPIAFLAKREYFERPGLRAVLRGVDAIPVHRGGYRSAQESLHLAVDVLARGGAFGIHPEGSRSPDGRLYRGRTGVAWLAMATGAPVVPVAVLGTDRVQPIGARLPRPRRITVRFGEPVRFTPGGGPGGPRRRQVTDEIMARIRDLSGQEPAGCFNQRSAG